MRTVLHASAALSIFALAGCILPIAADGAFSVKGSVVSVSNPPPKCELQLLRNARVVRTREVSGEYRETFVVAPAAATYDLQLHCNGALFQSVPVHYKGFTPQGGEVVFPEVRA